MKNKGDVGPFLIILLMMILVLIAFAYFMIITKGGFGELWQNAKMVFES